MSTSRVAPEHFVSDSCGGETCGMCNRAGARGVEATHKVGEEMLDDPRTRHNLTQYVCCAHFGKIFGPFAKLAGCA